MLCFLCVGGHQLGPFAVPSSVDPYAIKNVVNVLDKMPLSRVPGRWARTIRAQCIHEGITHMRPGDHIHLSGYDFQPIGTYVMLDDGFLDFTTEMLHKPAVAATPAEKADILDAYYDQEYPS